MASKVLTYNCRDSGVSPTLHVAMWFWATCSLSVQLVSQEGGKTDHVHLFELRYKPKTNSIYSSTGVTWNEGYLSTGDSNDFTERILITALMIQEAYHY